MPIRMQGRLRRSLENNFDADTKKNSMNLRTKVFSLIGVILVSFFLLVGFASRYVVMKDFSDLERREMMTNLDRVSETFKNKRGEISVKLSDWSQWDDTYSYVEDRNENFIQSNLQNSTLGLLHLNFIVLLGNDRSILVKKYVENGEEKEFPVSLEEHLITGLRTGRIDPYEAYEGIVRLPEGIVLYAVQPVRSSDGLSPARGNIVFGYFFDANVVAQLATLTHLDISFAPYDHGGIDDGFSLARENLSLDQPNFVGTPLNLETIPGYTLVSDTEKRPVFILRAEMNRDTYQKGQENLMLFFGVIVLSGVFFSVIILYVLRYFVLNKLSLLNKEINRIRQSGDTKSRIIFSGKDEFFQLAEAMNLMLQALSENEVILEQKTGELEKFQQAVDASFDHMVITDADGVILHANHAAEVLTGYTKKEMLGLRPSLWGRQMPKAFYETLWQTIKTEKQGYAGELTNKRKDGTSYLASIRVSPILDDAGEVKFFVGIERDITEDRRSQMRIIRHADELEAANVRIEEQKERSEGILRFLKSIGEGVFATDISGKVIFINEAAELIAMTPSSRVEGRKSGEVLSFIQEKEGQSIPMPIIERTLEMRKTTAFPQDTFLIRQTGEKIPVSGTCSLIRGTDRNIIGAIVVFRDVTKLRELDQMKNSFLSIAAHQLRTPLGSMRWSMELFLEGDFGKLPKTAIESLRHMYDNTVRMVLLVNDLLDVSLIDSEKGMEEQRPVDIVEMVREVIQTMDSEAKKRFVDIVFLEPDQPIPPLLAPPNHLYEALENLVSNGIKYNKQNGTLTLSLAMDGGKVLLSIADTGIGIPKEDTAKIFSKFFRSTNAILKETEGSGLGLSVVKSYLDESHAKISFESVENVGTTFYVEFPTGDQNGKA